MSARIITKAQAPDIIRNLVDDYQNKNFYGKVILTFQEGKIENVKVEQSFQTSELSDQYGAVHRKFVVRAKGATEEAPLVTETQLSENLKELE